MRPFKLTAYPLPALLSNENVRAWNNIFLGLNV